MAHAKGPKIMQNSRYVVAFNRDRDFYQVPLALEEEGKLARLVTDLYEPHSKIGRAIMKRAGLGHRCCAGLPADKVSWCWPAVWLQMVALKRARTAAQRNAAFHAIDSAISQAAGEAARRSGAGLFLYSGYAREAFVGVGSSSLPKLLFVYHPQGDFVRDLLMRDIERHPEVLESHRSHLDEIAVNEGKRVREELGLADSIVCASSFAAASVKSCAEAAGKLVAVVPYGFRGPNQLHQTAQKRGPVSKAKVLFVGQGVQRKGLHHLLKAWSRGLYKDAELTLVLSCLDPGIRGLIDSLPEQPRLLSGLTRRGLEEEYAHADIFVLPSLVEGFGLVYLEALAAGCLVVGTANTGLPDLNLGRDAARLARPGHVEDLEQVLRSAIQEARRGEIDRYLIQSATRGLSWRRFREGIRQFVAQAEKHILNQQQ